MRVYTYKKTIVDLKHFRHCSQHYELLLVLQRETPNLPLEVMDKDEKQKFIPIHILDLEDKQAINNLNPS